LLCTGGTGSFNRGDLLVLVCALCVALQVIYTGRFARRSDVMWLTGIQVAAVAGLSALTAGLRQHSVFTWEPAILWAILVCAVFATVFAFLVQTSMQRFTTATQTALIFCTEPIFGALYAYLAADERLGAGALAGALFILAGMIISELPATDGRSLAPAAPIAQPAGRPGSRPSR
jgi:drug/metabolite transporter (DMT)-like permease